MVLRAFGGMNNVAAREAIGDDEFYWLENLIPVAPGALYPVNAVSNSLVTIAETGAPSYVTTFNVTGTDYIFAVWANSGNAWVINIASLSPTKIVTGLLTSGLTSATQWSNLGILIVDPAGFWDWNVTTAATLTSQANGLLAATIVYAGKPPGGTSLTAAALPGGTGGALRTSYQVVLVALNAAGVNYAVNDIIQLTDNSPTSAAQIIVASIGGGGAITGITLALGGSYPGPTTGGGAFVTGPTGNVSTTSGIGTGATFTITMQANAVSVITRGSNYAAGTSNDVNGANQWTKVSYSVSGVISGTAIATYAGRAWIANGRVVSYTDINSYNSFGGAGGSFTITDAYLHKNVNALFSANNYLYIFGDDSIDALSNVTITGGVTSFTRLNITAAVGTSQPQSIQAYYRAIGFYHSSGFYLLAGATPEKISEKIQGVVNTITSTQSTPGVFSNPVYAGNVLVQSELCAAWQFQFTDSFSSFTPTTRTILALFFRGKWFAVSLESLVLNGTVSIPARGLGFIGTPIAGIQTLYCFSGNQLYQAFQNTALSNWILRTKLWDAGAPFREKQAINAASAFILQGASTLGVTMFVDTEYGSSPGVSEVFSQLQWINQSGQAVNWVNQLAQPVTWVISPMGYYLFVHAVESGGSQYVGLTLTGTGNNVTRIDLLGLRGKQDRNILE